MLLYEKKRFLSEIGIFFRTRYLRVRSFFFREVCCPADSYTIVSPVSMVRVGGNKDSQRLHILVYGRIDPPQSGIKVEVKFQGHQLDTALSDSGRTRPVIAFTDQAGEFVVDENFFCAPELKFITSVTSLPDIDGPAVIASLRLEKEQESYSRKCESGESCRPLPTATITIDFESHCQSSVTYWFENPYKKGVISRTTELSYCPTESSALYLKLSPHKDQHVNIIDIFTTSEEHPVPRYQRVHTRKMNEEFTRIAIFDSESTLKSALILV